MGITSISIMMLITYTTELMLSTVHHCKQITNYRSIFTLFTSILHHIIKNKTINKALVVHLGINYFATFLILLYTDHGYATLTSYSNWECCKAIGTHIIITLEIFCHFVLCVHVWGCRCLSGVSYYHYYITLFWNKTPYTSLFWEELTKRYLYCAPHITLQIEDM